MIKWLKKVKQIYQGWKNDLFPTQLIEEMSKPKLDICSKCPLNVEGVCSTGKYGLAVKDFDYEGEPRYRGKVYNGCGCLINKKTKSPTSKCPIGKW